MKITLFAKGCNLVTLKKFLYLWEVPQKRQKKKSDCVPQQRLDDRFMTISFRAIPGESKLTGKHHEKDKSPAAWLKKDGEPRDARQAAWALGLQGANCPILFVL